MWIGKAAHILLQVTLEAERALNQSARQQLAAVEAENRRFRSENDQLRATQEWMKLRLNHVELERAQLISAAIGVRVNVPQFVPAPANDPAAALNEMPDLSTLGGDARDDEPEGRATMEVPVDYSMLPGYRAPK